MRAYLVLMINYLFAYTMVGSVQNCLLLWSKYVLKMEHLFMWIILALQLSSVVGCILWYYLSKCIGKKFTYMAGLIFWVLLSVQVYFLDSMSPEFVIYITAGMAGVAVSAALLMPFSMLPDIVEYDTLKNGKKREGAFYSLFVLMQKIGLASVLYIILINVRHLV